MKIKKHPAVIAQDAWLTSPEGVRCAAPTLPLSGGAYYLENRLRLAFMAGWNAAEILLAPKRNKSKKTKHEHSRDK